MPVRPGAQPSSEAGSRASVSSRRPKPATGYALAAVPRQPDVLSGQTGASPVQFMAASGHLRTSSVAVLLL